MTGPCGRRAGVVGLAAVLALGLAACGGSPREAGPTDTPTAQPTSRALVPATKVLVVIEENHSYAQMREGMPYLAGLSDTYGYATHWTALRHPSEPNYLAIVGGSTFGVTDDGPPQAQQRKIGAADSVFDLALDAGRTAATYAQSMPANCHDSDYPAGAPRYVVRHNPWAYFPAGRTACLKLDQPLAAFAEDARANALPDIGFLIPDLGHDAHDGTLSAADDWLRSTLRPALQSSDFTTGRLVIIVTADEDDKHSGNRVLTSVLTPALSHKVTDAPLTHYSLTRYLCQVLGVPLLGNAVNAPDLSAAFGL
jgi:phosphatidylinositol-3-phosphatase